MPRSGEKGIARRLLDDLLLELRDSLGTTMVVVTHDLQSAFRVGDRIAMMDQGRIVEVGTPEEMRQSTNPVVRSFIDAVEEK